MRPPSLTLHPTYTYSDSTPLLAFCFNVQLTSLDVVVHIWLRQPDMDPLSITAGVIAVTTIDPGGLGRPAWSHPCPRQRSPILQRPAPGRYRCRRQESLGHGRTWPRRPGFPRPDLPGQDVLAGAKNYPREAAGCRLQKAIPRPFPEFYCGGQSSGGWCCCRMKSSKSSRV